MLLNIQNPRVYFTARSLKHLAEKAQEGARLLRLVPCILNSPVELRKAKTKSNVLFIRYVHKRSSLQPHVVALEVKKDHGCIIITAFQSDLKYISNSDLLWRTGIPKGKVPPSAYSSKTNAGGRPVFSALREDQNSKS